MTAEVSTETEPRPQVLGGVVTYMTVDGASKAAEFYKRAFGATEVFRYPIDDSGRTMHIHLHINGSSVMLGDAYPEHGCLLEKPQGFSLQLIVDDIDAWWRRAVEAGAKVVMPVDVMFWGDRYGQLRDPFGIVWAMNAPVAPSVFV
ncbi:VOC family protein [Rhizobium tubonense]|uniref:Glyoxalase n=1 Tax=Rhizobium tubonense TaxID=484088 RepID=A0A2W4EUM6_9HYPH|nr:glyoxalase/bleomycin resistance/extradiol dioxygenase family protein [Rhizobium tubonense]PZM14483.1 glyoxalase [Rhizobium tubonense]